MPEISVIIPVYNVENYLRRCIDSILSQSFNDLEVLLIDDGSTDSSGDICDEYAELDSRVRVVHKEYTGVSDVRNLGISMSKGNYIFFIDSDDFIEEDAITVLWENLQKERADISAGSIFNCYQDKKIPQCPELRYGVYTGKEALKETLIGKNITGSLCGKIISKELFDGLSFKVGKTYEDALMMPDLLLKTTKMVVTTQALYNYWHRRGSLTTATFSEVRMDVIDAYKYTKEVVEERCPELAEFADFRLMWAYFVVLDCMLVSPNFEELPQYGEIVGFLKKNWLNVFNCKYFSHGRRIAALALKMSVSLYKSMLEKKNDRDMLEA